VDDALTQWINGFAGGGGGLDAAMRIITSFGVPAMILLVVAQWWSPLPRRLHVRHAIVAAGLSCLVGFAVNQLILLFVHRARPYDAGLTHLIVQPSAEWSFPSDHATVAAAIAAAWGLHREPYRAIAFGVMAAAVGVSRIFVGTHYLSDVLGGFATAVAAAILVRALYHPGTRFDRAVTGVL
jgi:undecaprenyl-diphosphatase